MEWSAQHAEAQSHAFTLARGIKRVEVAIDTGAGRDQSLLSGALPIGPPVQRIMRYLESPRMSKSMIIWHQELDGRRSWTNPHLLHPHVISVDSTDEFARAFSSA
jgi:hypothetical protein